MSGLDDDDYRLSLSICYIIIFIWKNILPHAIFIDFYMVRMARHSIYGPATAAAK